MDVRLGLSWISVSPHDPAGWVLREGSELKLVPGLAGRGLTDFAPHLDGTCFEHRFVQPCAGHEPSRVECIEWVKQRAGWRLGVQAHGLWGLP